MDYWSKLPGLASQARLLIAPGSEAVKLFELATLKSREIAVPYTHAAKTAVSSDGRLLAWALFLNEMQVLIFDTASGKELRTFTAPWPLTDFCLSPNGEFLAACGHKGLRIWDIATGTILADFNGHRGAVAKVAFSPDGGTLVSAGHDGTMLVWDVAALIAKPPLADLAPGELITLWQQLASADAVAAGEAMRRLTAFPQQSAALLRDKLTPVAAVPKEKIAKLVDDLDAAQPKVRANATTELEKMAELAEPALRACLTAMPTLEQRMRAEKLLARLGEPLTDADKLRSLRAIEVLELLATAQSAQVLRTLASGADSALVTRQARRRCGAWAMSINL